MKRISDVCTWFEPETQMYKCSVTVECTYDELKLIEENLNRLLKVNSENVENDNGEYKP